jgi:hypothetical protein
LMAVVVVVLGGQLEQERQEADDHSNLRAWNVMMG